MPSNSDIFLNKVLGSDFLEGLSKTELWKPGTKSVVDIDDMRIGLKIVPRTILSFLVHELTPMGVGDNKEVKIPVDGDGVLKVTKHERDQYSGEIIHNNKIATEFKFRSLPGVGLVIMSAFELYDVDELDRKPDVSEDIELKVQKMIDERIALHDLVERVVEKKLSQREAVSNLMLMRLTDEIKKAKKKAIQVAELRNINERSTPQSDQYFRGMTNGLAVADSVVNKTEPKFVETPKKKPLAEFLDKKKKKKPKEFVIQLAKGEEISCPDCRKHIFSESAFSGCVCLGADMDKKLFIKKSEDGVSVRFSRGWDPENISLLLEVLQKKNR
jgi:hypothetical protein